MDLSNEQIVRQARIAFGMQYCAIPVLEHCSSTETGEEHPK